MLSINYPIDFAKLTYTTYVCRISQYVCVYIVYVIYTDRKPEISELENRQIILTEHLSSYSPEGTRMKTNFSPGYAWDLHQRRRTLKL